MAENKQTAVRPSPLGATDLRTLCSPPRLPVQSRHERQAEGIRVSEAAERLPHWKWSRDGDHACGAIHKSDRRSAQPRDLGLRSLPIILCLVRSSAYGLRESAAAEYPATLAAMGLTK